MKAVKANKEYTIDEKMKSQYKRDGFDIYTDDGELIEGGAGKTVPFEDYAAVLQELEAFKGEEKPKRTRGDKA